MRYTRFLFDGNIVAVSNQLGQASDGCLAQFLFGRMRSGFFGQFFERLAVRDGSCSKNGGLCHIGGATAAVCVIVKSEEVAAMIRVAIVEDGPIYSSQFRDYLKRYEAQSGEECRVVCFGDGDEIAADYRPDYDIILMDIDMKFMDGMTTASHIRKLDSEVIIIFITNLSQYAIKGYAVDALDYMLKPISYYAFSQCIERALSRMQYRNQKHFLLAHTKSGVQKLDVACIYFVEVEGRNLLFHTSDGVISASGPMRRVEQSLSEADFFRCNKGYLVNMAHVSCVEGSDAVVGGERVQISRSKRKAFLDALNDYMNEVSK